jgi:hypothetical protein
MELLFALIIVVFFIILNEIRIGLTGEENTASEILIGLSTILFGFLYSLFI